MAAANLPITVFKCTYQGCRSTPFLTKSNLNRHEKSVHGLKVPMLCGEERPDHSSNRKRHEKTCKKCQNIKSQRSRASASSGDQLTGADDTPPPSPPPPSDPPAESRTATGLSGIDEGSAIGSDIPEDDLELLLDMSDWLYDDSVYPDQNGL